MSYPGDGRLPILYVRGFAGSGVASEVDEPVYGFNAGSAHVRVDGSRAPRLRQFDSPLLRLLTADRHNELVHGDQRAYLERCADGERDADTVWIHRCYDVSASPLGYRPVEFSVGRAAENLFDLVETVRRKTGAPRVFLVAHSM